MKSDVNLVRKLNDFNVIQRTGDGFFNASSLIRQWNSIEGNKSKKLSNYFDSKQTKDFIKTVEERNSTKISVDGITATTDYQAVRVVNKRKKSVGQKWTNH